MSIEVRQMSIRCQVLLPASAVAPPMTSRELAAMKEKLLAECKALLREQLQHSKER
jgi:hypothetical protein